MRYAKFVIGRAAQSPIPQFFIKHAGDFFWIILVGLAIYFLGPGVLQAMGVMVNPTSAAYSSTPAVENKGESIINSEGEWSQCNIYSTSLQIFISDDGISYLNKDFNLEMYRNGALYYKGSADEVDYFELPPGESITLKLFPLTEKYEYSSDEFILPCESYVVNDIRPIRRSSAMVVVYDINSYFVHIR